MSTPDRRAMLDSAHPKLDPATMHAALDQLIRRVSVRERPANGDDDLALMRRLDELFLASPFLGSRRMAAMLSVDGERVSRKRGRGLMRSMGIAALGPKPRTTKPSPGRFTCSQEIALSPSDNGPEQRSIQNHVNVRPSLLGRDP
jgi:putative transposase